MLPLFALAAVAAAFLYMRSQPAAPQALPSPPSPPPPSTQTDADFLKSFAGPPDVPDELTRLGRTNTDLAGRLKNTLQAGNPYYLAQYVSVLAAQGYPALAQYVADEVKRQARPVTAQSGRPWLNWGVDLTGPLSFTTPDGHSKATYDKGWSVVWVLRAEINPSPAIVYGQYLGNPKSRTLMEVAPGADPAVVQAAIADFNIVDRNGLA